MGTPYRLGRLVCIHRVHCMDCYKGVTIARVKDASLDSVKPQ